jgi:hypothetical protein
VGVILRLYMTLFYWRGSQFFMAKTLYPDRFISINMENEENNVIVASRRVDDVFDKYANDLIFSKARQI